MKNAHENMAIYNFFRFPNFKCALNYSPRLFEQLAKSCGVPNSPELLPILIK